MKKILLLAFLLMHCLTAAAANDGDTIYGRYRYYYYPYAFEDFRNGMPIIDGVQYSIGRFHTEYVFDASDSMYFNTSVCKPVYIYSKEFACMRHSDDTLHIIGISFIEDSIYWGGWYANEPFLPENRSYTVTLFDSNMNALRTASSSVDDLLRGPMWLLGEWSNAIGRFREIYFNDTIDIAGTFYISMKVFHMDTLCYSSTEVIGETHAWHGSCPDPYYYHIPYEHRKYRTSLGDSWHDEPCGYGHTTLIYPILEFDEDSCVAPEVQYQPAGLASSATAAIVYWQQDDNHDFYEISYGPEGTPPGEGTVATTALTHYLIQNLDRNTRYDVYVRARCDFAHTQWSPWSDALHILLATYGIDDVETVSWSVTPNPARGTATVRCDVGMMSVELLSVKGDIVQHHDLKGDTVCTLDLAGIAKGVYVVVIATPLGSSSRRLVVIR